MDSNLSNIDQEFEQIKNNRIYLEPAKKLKEKLQPIKSNVEGYAKRWFWELLQNACDYNDLVKVRLIISDNKVIFEHNGKPFSMDDALNLIHPYSDKDNDSPTDSIGQFGTGFISTHVLSSKIQVKSKLLLKDNTLNNFCFNLNRNNFENKDVIAEKLQISESTFRDSIIPYTSASEYSTSFTYYLDEQFEFVKTYDVVGIGLNFIEKILGYVFAFNDNLDEVILSMNGIVKKYSASKVGEKVIINYKSINSKDNSIENTSFDIIRTVHNDSFVACRIDQGSIPSFNSDIPKLFCAFPLLESNGFPFPAIVHSRKFEPSTERKSAEFSSNDLTNRELLEDAISAYHKLIDYLNENSIKALYNLSHISSFDFKNVEQNAWFKKSITDKLKLIVEEKIEIDTNNGRKFLSQCLIPTCEKQELVGRFHSICSRTIKSIPSKEESAAWSEVLDFRIFGNLKYNLEKLLTHLKDYSPTTSFLQKNEDVYGWLKDLVEHIILTEKKQLLERNRLIPDKSNFKHTSKANLFWDEDIPDKLKEIYKLLTGNDYDKKLIREIMEPLGEALWPIERKKSESDISKEIDDFLLKYNESEYSHDFLQGLKELFNWTDNKQSHELFPWFTSNKAMLMLNSLQSERDRSMAFDFLRSDKREIVSEIISSDITKENLKLFMENQEAFVTFINWKNSTIDDSDASLDLGNIGEKIIYNILLNRFKDDSDVEVFWSAKKGESRYDFEIKKNGTAWIYIDAKTTNKGIDNADSVPFFMRKAQWDFLPNLQSHQMYLVARVFYSENLTVVRWLKLKNETI